MMIFYVLSIVLYKCNQLSFADSDFPQQLTPSNSKLIAAAASYEPADSDENNYNGLIFQFRRSIKSDNTEIEARRRSALDKNFMRFGRSDKSLMRFGRSGSDKDLVRLGRPDGFMRLGRSDPTMVDNDRAKDDMNRIELVKPLQSAATQNYENLGSKIFRYGRAGVDRDSSEESSRESAEKESSFTNNKKNFMRFGRADKNLMRFGRADKNLMRFGRADKNLMRFGRADKNLMRFGRGDKNLMRFGRGDKNLMRFGRSDQSLMRFGRSGAKMRFGRLDPSMIPISEIFCEDNKCILRKNGEVLEVIDVRKNTTGGIQSTTGDDDLPSYNYKDISQEDIGNSDEFAYYLKEETNNNNSNDKDDYELMQKE